MCADITDVLIIEDEENIAEFYAQYIQKRQPKFRAIGIAKDIAQAKEMIQILKPELILLDNYLPDGQGSELLKQLHFEKHRPDVIFITAASDMQTITDVVRSGVFDYLIKPITYDRLNESLTRYQEYRSSIKAKDSVNQRYLDRMLHATQFDDPQEANKGIDPLTLAQVKACFSALEADEYYTADTLMLQLKVSKTTARRYLEHCVSTHFLQAEICHGKVGRPERRYRIKATD